MNLFRGLWARGRWAILLAATFTLVFAAAASAAYKPYSVVMTGSVDSTGTTVSAVFTNETTPQQLGSANLTAPAGYTISAATVTQGTAKVVGGTVVQLRNLSLQSNKSLTVSLTISGAACSTEQWSVVAKQANDFSGPPGNDMNLDTAKSNLLTSLCSAPCSKNATCTAAIKNSGGGVNIAAGKGQSTGSVQEAANTSKLTPLNCAGYTSADPNVYDFLTTEDRTKVVSLTITDPAIALTGTINTILAEQQICLDAPYDFTTVSGGLAPSDGNGGFIGLMQTCTLRSVGPCHNRGADKAVPDLNSPIGYDLVLVANIPSGLPGDPHMG